MALGGTPPPIVHHATIRRHWLVQFIVYWATGDNIVLGNKEMLRWFLHYGVSSDKIYFMKVHLARITFQHIMV